MIHTCKLLSLVAAACLTSCGSADEGALEAMVAKRLENPPNLKVSDPVIYRDGDARLACVTATWENQFGEAKPEAMFLAWYIPKTKSWHTDNPQQPGPEGCQFYADPDWKAKRSEQAAAARAADAESFNTSVQAMMEEDAREAEAQGVIQAQREREIEAAEAAGHATADAEARRLAAEEAAREAAAAKALEESLARGPVDTTRDR